MKTLDFYKKVCYNQSNNIGRSSAAQHERLEEKTEVNALDFVKAFTNEQLKTEVPEFNVGDTVKVYQRIVEGQRVRTQIFEGTVIARKNGGISETFTVRRVSYGVGTEKTFPIHSPNVQQVEVVRRGKVRRAKLYYLRDKVGKNAKVKEKI